MYNGPCGGGSEGVCEVSRRECPWVTTFSKNPENSVFEWIILDRKFKVVKLPPDRERAISNLVKKMYKRRVSTYEYVVGFTLDLKSFREDLKSLSRFYDAVNFVDTPLGLPHLEPLGLALESLRVGVEPVLQISCKGKSRGQIVATLLSAGLLGVKNVLAVTGDWPLLGDKFSTPVFDLDAVRMIYLAKIMRELKVDYSGRKIGEKLEYNIGAAFNPYFQPLNLEVKRTIKKVKAGAEFLVSQPIFHSEVLRGFIKTLGKSVEPFLIPSIIALPNPHIALKLEEFARVKTSKEYIEALEKGKARLLEHLEKLVEELSSIDVIAGIHVLTLGNHKLGLELGSVIRRVLD